MYFWPLVKTPAILALNSASDPSRVVGAIRSPREYANMFRVDIRDSDSATILASQIVSPEMPRNFVVELTHEEIPKELSDNPISPMVGVPPILNCKDNTIRPAVKDSIRKAAVYN